VFYGLQPAVIAIVASAVLKIGSKALKNWIMWTVAALAFVGIFFLKVHFVLIILGAALIGLIGGKLNPAKFAIAKGHSEEAGSAVILSDDEGTPLHRIPTWSRAAQVTMICLLLWWIPIIASGVWQGWNEILFQEGLFFSKAAVVTFGGAYAVLPYVAQQAVDTYGWLSTSQMIAGLGLAETTPGPLIMVLQFVGFVGAWQNPGNLHPLVAATLGAAITTWATFLPCFMFIFLGAPHIERLRNVTALSAALATITAAVVGVVLNLAVWFALHVIFPPHQPVDWFAIISASIFFFGIHRLRWDVVPVVLASGMLGVLYKLLLP
jgi:chromate transporter